MRTAAGSHSELWLRRVKPDSLCGGDAALGKVYIMKWGTPEDGDKNDSRARTTPDEINAMIVIQATFSFFLSPAWSTGMQETHHETLSLVALPQSPNARRLVAVQTEHHRWLRTAAARGGVLASMSLSYRDQWCVSIETLTSLIELLWAALSVTCRCGGLAVPHRYICTARTNHPTGITGSKSKSIR